MGGFGGQGASFEALGVGPPQLPMPGFARGGFCKRGGVLQQGSTAHPALKILALMTAGRIPAGLQQLGGDATLQARAASACALLTAST